MKYKKIYYILLIALYHSLFFINYSYANNFFQFETDYAVFHGSDDKSILEIYYSFYQKGLLYKFTEGEYKADGFLEISITQLEDNEVILFKQFKVPSSINDTSNNALNKNFVGQLNFFLISGNEYKLQIVGSDFNDPLSSDTVNEIVNLSVPSVSLEASDLQLASNIVKSSDKENIFYKNKLEILPNPQKLFGNNLDKLFYYCEIYGLNDSAGSTKFSVNELILNSNNDTLYHKQKPQNSHGKSLVEFNNIPVNNFQSGIYFLKIIVTDLTNNNKVEKEKKFLVYNNKIQNNPSDASDDGFLKSEYANMNPDQVEMDFEITLYIRTKIETKNFKSLQDINDKRKFLYQFWKSKDDNLQTPQNEFKINFKKKISEANSLFKENFKEGWKTDRGRIYIVYGKPDDVDRYPFESGTNSYEIWKYNSSGQNNELGECVFVEKDASTGFYDLVHCTFKGELQNENWKRELAH